MTHTAFYQQARYYEIAFGYRDIAEEVSRLSGIYRHHTGTEASSFLELACGPGYHTLEFARRGVRSVGIDLSERMVELANERACNRELRLASFFQGDMTDFDLDTPVDLAATFLTSLMYLPTDHDLMRHFGSVARNLKPGGIYFIEANDPRDYQDMRYHGNSWRMTEGDTTVEASYGLDAPAIDPVTHLFTSLAEYQVTDRDGNSVLTLREEGVLHALWPADFVCMIGKTSGLEIAGIYGDWDVTKPLDEGPETWRTVIVARKV